MKSTFLTAVVTGLASLSIYSQSDPAAATERTERKTVVILEKSDADLNQNMERWAREGWSVMSVSSRLPAVDGSVRREVELRRSRDEVAVRVAYDDRKIARLRLGDTTKAEVLEWFGSPEKQVVNLDGAAQMTWDFSTPTDKGVVESGALRVSFTSNERVKCYSAGRKPMEQHENIEYVEKSYLDLAAHEEQWTREGWKILSLSGAFPQADGTVHRKAQLSRGASELNDRGRYDDKKVGSIRVRETTEAQLLEQFGAPDNRDAKADRTTDLAWSFAPGGNSSTATAGALRVSLGSDGKVSFYSAVRSRE